MIGIVVVAHGGLAAEYVRAMEHVVGSQDGVQTVQISADYDRSSKQAEINAAVIEVDMGTGVVVITDLYGGSPSNLCMMACGTEGKRRVIYGANLPLLVKLAKARGKSLDKAVELALKAGHKYMDAVPVQTAD
ncbi:MAG: PTS sugar transporter subunit IIA [Planktomarina sp.]